MEPFSLTNVSRTRLGVGNPLAVHNGDPPTRLWEHLRVFAYRGLRELFEQHRFRVDAILDAGYYPLPTAAARLDPRHAAFLTIRGFR